MPAKGAVNTNPHWVVTPRGVKNKAIVEKCDKEEQVAVTVLLLPV